MIIHRNTDKHWSDLAAKAQTGDKKAYAALLKDILPYIQKFLAPRLANPDWVDDVAQDVLLSVHKALKTYSKDRPFKPWLHAIIQFRKADYLRRHYGRKGDKSVSIDDQINLAADVTSPDALAELGNVDKVLSALPDTQRRIFEMIKIQGYSAQEVSQATGMSESAVKVSAHRTLSKLKENMG
jgi:RNA polymerase sigma-70 factor (ECF subfamily)